MVVRELTPEQRQQRLSEARRALASRDASAMRVALANLPSNGSKAASLRSALRERLADKDSSRGLPAPYAAALPTAKSTGGAHSPGLSVLRGTVGDAHAYDVWLADFEGPDLLRVNVVGGSARVEVSRSHRIRPLFVNDSGTPQNDLAGALLLALAGLEVEAGSELKRERARELRLDLCRVLARQMA
jgi:hypothetical protein